MIDVNKFLPEKLKNEPLFEKVSRLLQYVIDEYFQGNYEYVKNAYNVFFSGEVVKKLVELIDTDEFSSILNEKEKVQVLWFIQILQRLRGTRKGLKFFLYLLGLEEARIYTWYEINSGTANLVPKLDCNEIPPCNIVIDALLEEGWVLNNETQEILRKWFGLYLHACIKIYEVRLSYLMRVFVSNMYAGGMGETEGCSQMRDYFEWESKGFFGFLVGNMGEVSAVAEFVEV